MGLKINKKEATPNYLYCLMSLYARKNSVEEYKLQKKIFLNRCSETYYGNNSRFYICVLVENKILSVLVMNFGN